MRKFSRELELFFTSLRKFKIEIELLIFRENIHNYDIAFWIPHHQAIVFKRHFRATSFPNVPSKPFSNLKYPSFSPTTLLYSFLDTSTPSNTFQRHFRTSSFLNVLSKPILQIEVLIFFTTTLLYDFLHTPTSSNTFQKALLCPFRTSSLRNVLPKPILQVEVLIFFPTTLLYDFFAHPDIKQYFPKGFIISLQNKFFS